VTIGGVTWFIGRHNQNKEEQSYVTKKLVRPLTFLLMTLCPK